MRAYDPAFGYELAVIIAEGIRRMYQQGEDLIYYLTVQNQTYEMPPMPPGAQEGILRGNVPAAPRWFKAGAEGLFVR